MTSAHRLKAYGAIYRGVVQYYLHAGDVYRLERLRWTIETSLLRTLAAKHHSTATKMAARHRATVETPHGPRICYQAVRTRCHPDRRGMSGQAPGDELDEPRGEVFGVTDAEAAPSRHGRRDDPRPARRVRRPWRAWPRAGKPARRWSR